MLSRALLLSVVLAGVLGCTDALAARTVVRVGGDVKAIAFAGDALIVARQRVDGSLRVERSAPGAAVRTVLRLPRSRRSYSVSLAGSAQALAVGVNDRQRNDRVVGGPSAGPLRLLASCRGALFVPPVAVSGSRLAWPEGGCLAPTDDGRLVGPLAFVLGDADAGVPLRRLSVGFEASATAIVLNADSGLVGVMRPSSSSYSFDGEARPFGIGGLGEPVTREKEGVLTPVGVLSNGDTVYVRGDFDGDDSQSAPGDCASRLFVLAPGSSQRRELSLGGCAVDQLPPLSGTRVAGDRVYALVRRQGSVEGDGLPVSLKSFRGDGGAARLWARGTYRRPLGVATSETRGVAWWQQGCSGGSEIVIDDGAPPVTSSAIPSCSVKVLTRWARVRAGQITVRLRCALGCSGFAGVDPKYRRTRSYAFASGTHSLRLRVTRRQRAVKRVRVRIRVEAGAFRTATIRLR